ncbi:MAG TPA: putative Ig domain-containing protein [Candidatus Eisenbacteria bacterium]
MRRLPRDSSPVRSTLLALLFPALLALSFSAAPARSLAATADQAPVVTAPASESVFAGSLLAFTVAASDPDGDAITSLAASPLPAGATFTANASATSGTLAWTPTILQGGSYTVTFTAANALSGTASTTISVDATTDRPPIVQAPAKLDVNENALLTFMVSASDPDGDAIFSLTASPLPAGASFTANVAHTSGTFSWTPSFSQRGTYNVTFTASNALSGSAVTQINVATNPDRAPAVTAPATENACEAVLLAFTVSASDPDGDPINSLTASPLPTGATFSASAAQTSGTFSWTPSFTQAGSYTVTFTAANALTGTASTSIAVLNACDQPPVVTAPATASGVTNVDLRFTVFASSPDGLAITSLTAAPLPAFATFTPNATNTSGTFDWTPTFSQSGTYYVTFTAVDEASLSGSATTAISVGLGPDRPPVVTAPSVESVCPLTPLTFTVTAFDPDGDVINSLTASPLPLGATFTSGPSHTSGTFSWTPDLASGGSYNVTFTASNALSGSASTGITVLQAGVCDLAPIANPGGPYFGLVAVPLTFDGSASSDPEGEALTYQWDFGDQTAGSGVMPAHTYVVPALYTVTLVVTDPEGLTGSASTTANIAAACDARLFQTGGDRAIRLGSQKPRWCTEVEPAGGCFSIDQVVLSSVVLRYPAGSGPSIASESDKSAVGGDADKNGIPDLTVCFAKEDLRRLFAGLPSGKNEVEVTVEGQLVTGGAFVGTATVEVFGDGASQAAQVTPNPLRSGGDLSFTAAKPGPARIRLFDLNGRLVRSLFETATSAGARHVPLDARDDAGRPLPSGIYFFRIETADGIETGRVLIAR